MSDPYKRVVVGRGIKMDEGVTIDTEYNYTTTPYYSILYDTPGTYQWVCPADTYEVNVCCIGGGGAGSYVPMGSYGRFGGGGGGLGWRNYIPVTPGQSYTVVVGAGGTWAQGGSLNGGDSYFINTTTVAGFGGKYSTGIGGSFVGDNGGKGGDGGQGLWPLTGSAVSSGAGAGPGGGAGGYAGNGGRGGWIPIASSKTTNPVVWPTPAQANSGAAGGGWAYTCSSGGSDPPNPPNGYGAGPGGSGTGIQGIGITGGVWNGKEWTTTDFFLYETFMQQGWPGQAGSGGQQGQIGQHPVFPKRYYKGGDGGAYGGGGGSIGYKWNGDTPSNTLDMPGSGGRGCVRILAGLGKIWPNHSEYMGTNPDS